MIAAFIYLQTRSLANRLGSRLKRLKQPKYLIGGIAGALYVYIYFVQYLFFGSPRARPGSGLPEDTLEIIGAVVLLITVLLAWIIPHKRSALVFSESEVAFLFPAPISRRALVHYKLIRSQTAILFTTLILALVTGRVAAGGGIWMRVLGWWIILSTINLHLLGASFARTLLLDRGISNWLRRAMVVGVVAALVAATVFWTRDALRLFSERDIAGWQSVLALLRELASAPPLSYVLFPFKLIIQPFLATSPEGFLRALPLAFAVLLAHYLWVIRSNVAFEEASLDLSRRMAERIAAARSGKHPLDGQPARPERAPFALSPSGPAAIAIFWKNLINARSTFRLRTLVIVLIPVMVLGAMLGSERSEGHILMPVLTMITGMFFVWSLVIGGQFVRHDLRHDVQAMDLLKTLPMPGWQIVLGEILAPVVILTCLQGALLLLLLVFVVQGHSDPQVPLGLAAPVTAAMMFLLPLWNGVLLLIPNATVLLFPGWFQTRADAPQGIEVMGQRLILFIAQMLVAIVAIIPAAIGFALGFIPAQAFSAPWLGLFAGSLLAGCAFAAEIALGIVLLGKLFDQFDLSLEQA